MFYFSVVSKFSDNRGTILREYWAEGHFVGQLSEEYRIKVN